jgi:hypothetical protein
MVIIVEGSWFAVVRLSRREWPDFLDRKFRIRQREGDIRPHAICR